MAWVVNSVPQPSCALEGQLSWVLVHGGWAVKAWLVCEGQLLSLQSCCPFRARSATLAPLAGAGCLLPPAPGGGSPYFGVLR